MKTLKTASMILLSGFAALALVACGDSSSSNDPVGPGLSSQTPGSSNSGGNGGEGTSSEGGNPGGNSSTATSSASGGGNTDPSDWTPMTSMFDIGSGAGGASTGEATSCGTATGDIPASDPCIRYIGRAMASDTAVSFNWASMVITAKFSGTSVGVKMQGEDIMWFDAFIDDDTVAVPTIAAPAGKSYPVNSNGQTMMTGTLKLFKDVQNYTIKTGLADGEHTIRLVKRSETNNTLVVFKGFTLDAGKGLSPLPPRPSRRIEILGDSYSVGYGNESPSKTSPTAQDRSGNDCTDDEFHAYTNNNLAYGALAGRKLGAEYQINAYSGLGMVRNYAGHTYVQNFPFYYGHVFQHSEVPSYDPNTYHPHVIVIMIGTNDFSTPVNCSVCENPEQWADQAALDAAYRQRYHQLLATLRQIHPGVKFVLAGTNLFNSDTGELNNELMDQVNLVIAEERAAGNTDMNESAIQLRNSTGYGCGWHPELAVHNTWSTWISNQIKQLMNWD